MNSGHPLFFRASASYSKILNSKKYIQYSEKFQGKLFSGQGQIVKNPEYKKYIHYSENFLGDFVFSGQAQEKISTTFGDAQKNLGGFASEFPHVAAGLWLHAG